MLEVVCSVGTRRLCRVFLSFSSHRALRSRGVRRESSRALHPLRNLLTAREYHIERSLNLRQFALELDLVLDLSSQAGEEGVD